VTADAPKRSGVQPAANTGATFPRAARLLKHSDFDRVYKQGRRHFSSHMTVYYLRQAEVALPEHIATETASAQKIARVGFTVGKVLGGAVERNRIKRRMREAVRQRRRSTRHCPSQLTSFTRTDWTKSNASRHAPCNSDPRSV
jgi:ribonuclease P protein component